MTLPLNLPARLFLAVLLALVCTVTVTFGQGSLRDGEPLSVGDEAPRFFNHQLSGGSFYLSDWCGPGNDVRNFRIKRGDIPKQAVVLSFFATWCGPCRRELPEFERLRGAFDGYPVKWRVVNVGDDPDSAAAMLERFQVETECLLDRYLVTTKRYAGDSIALPLTVVIDQERVVRYLHTGYDVAVGLRDMAQVVADVLGTSVPEEWTHPTGASVDSSRAEATTEAPRD